MEAIFECSLKVRAHDTDSTGKWKVSSAFDCMQDMAAAHAEGLGVGLGDVLRRGMFWVLSWARLEFTSFPLFGQDFRAKTWPKCEQKLFSIRDFLFLDGQGNDICRATTAWLLVDIKTKKAVSARGLRSGIPYQEGTTALDCLPEKFCSREDAKAVYTRPIRYSDLDINRHVNNARYIEFFTDCYGVDHHRKNQVKSLTVSFLAESKHGDELHFRMSEGAGNGSGHFPEVCNAAAGTPVVQAAVEWAPAQPLQPLMNI